MFHQAPFFLNYHCNIILFPIFVSYNCVLWFIFQQYTHIKQYFHVAITSFR